MQVFGAIFCGLAVFQLAILVLSSCQSALGKRRQNRLALEALQEQVRAAKTARIQQEQRQLCWNGVRKFEVARKTEEARNICSFELVPHDRKPLPRFLPGQFLTFHLRPEGTERQVVRCYSISSPPNPDYFRVTIKRVFPPDEMSSAPPGLISNYFHDEINVGDILDVEAPRGKFYIDPNLVRPRVFIAGGVGITPFISMIHALAESNVTTDTILFYGIHGREDEAFRDELNGILNASDNLTVHVCFSQENGVARSVEETSPAKIHHQKITLDLLQRELGTSNYDFYLCGPPPMMDCLIADLQSWGVPKSQIFTEAFGPATGKAVRKVQMSHQEDNGKDDNQQVVPASPYRVCFSKSDKQAVWDPAVTSLLELARQLDVEVESGCESGHCGTCVLAIKSGSTICTNEQGAETEEGTCLACISVPCENLVLDA
ncbi:MAG: 2Fe-2S iron-sulfur cluster-binding protein [Planctomycetaceae bacterium]